MRDYSDSTPDVNFYYDGRGLGSVPAYSKGKATKVANSISETRYTQFDNLGRLLTHQQITHGNTYQTEYTYNLSGAMMTEKYPSGRVMNYEYRADGELDKLTGTRGGNTAIKTYLSDISYNTLGNIEKMKLGNGTWESAQYNNRQQISQIALGSFEDDDSLLKIDYEYGTTNQNNGSLRKQTINYNGLTHGIVQDYSYDDLNRLKSATETSNNSQTWKQTFNYDRYGNREFDETNTDTLNQNIATKITNPDIEASNNRLKKDQDGDSVDDYGYDKSGNLKLDAENQRFIYDAENRIKEFFKGTNSTQTADATYEYDGDGKRVRKISGTKETIFVYNASGQLVAEYSDELPPNPKVSYLTADHLGSPRIITDDDRDVVSRHDYLAFGDEVTETVGNLAGRTTTQGYGQDDDIRKQYTGYERDKESGLDFAQARYYNSQHGRFTSVDPLTTSANVKNPQTFNRYSYVMNSPYKFTDPLGLLAVHSGSYGNGLEGGGGGGITGAMSSAWANPLFMKQQQQTSEPIPALLIQSSQMNFTVTQGKGKGVVQLDFTVTTKTYLVCDGCSGFNDLSIETRSTGTASVGSDNTFSFSQSQLDNAGAIAAQVVASATAMEVAVETALAIAANESFFGVVSGGGIASTQSDINPLKLTPKQFNDGTQPQSAEQAGSKKAALKHNVQNALRLFRDDKMKNRTLEQGLKKYGDPKDANYVKNSLNYINQIKRTTKTKTTTPYVLETISID